MMAHRPRLQRCNHYVPGLKATPWWTSEDLPFTAALENNFKAIQSEFFDVVLSGSLKLHPQSAGGPRKTITNGDWNIFELLSKGRPNVANAIEAPVTTRILRSLPELTTHPFGLVYFSVLGPHVRVFPHCGPTNTRIRIHLGLQVPPGAEIRVGGETRTWQEGKCIVFDDSWEHEAFNPSDRMRAVLLLDAWHPDLSPEQREGMLTTHSSGGQKRLREREGWYRKAASEPCAPLVDSVFKTLNHDRIASIRTTANRLRALFHRDSYLFLCASFVLRCLGEQQAGDEANQEALINAAPYYSLQEALRSAVYPSELANVVQILSLYWRSHLENLQWMYKFGQCWLASEKSALFDKLVGRQTPDRMIECLLQDGSEREGLPPFGLVASVLVAAFRSVTTQAYW